MYYYFFITTLNCVIFSTFLFLSLLSLQVTIARHCGLGGDYGARNHTYSALSRCNGNNGSFKLTATPGHLQRAHTFNNGHGHRLDVARASLDAGIVGAGDGTSPNASPPIHTVGSAPTFPQRYRASNSPTTLLTLSRIDGNGVTTIQTKPSAHTDYLCNNNRVSHTEMPIKSPAKKSMATHMVPSATTASGTATTVATVMSTTTTMPTTHTTTTSALSSLAEKLRRGTKKVLHFKTTQPASSGSQATKEHHSGRGKLEKGNSVDSAHTNTISNSSLQEVDDDEFESTELAKYMGQINSEIR